MSNRPKLRAINQTLAATHLHGLLGAKEIPDVVAPPVRKKQKPRTSRMLLVIAAVCAVAVIGVSANNYLKERARLAEIARIEEQRRQEALRREQARLAELARIEAQQRMARADAQSWDLIARSLLDNELVPDFSRALLDPDPDLLRPDPPRLGGLLFSDGMDLRSPATILDMHRQMLSSQTGPGWDDTSPGQRSNVSAILNAYIAAFERLQRVPTLEERLYLRRGLSLGAGLVPADAQTMLNAMSELPSAFARIKSVWASMPQGVPRDNVRKLLALTDARIQLLEQEIALMRFLAETSRSWRAQPRNPDRVTMPTFANRGLAEQYRFVLSVEAQRYSALFNVLAPQMTPTLVRQLKPQVR